jgi:hypothetical protein
MRNLAMGIVCLALCAVPALADTTYNNYGGSNPYWNPFGNPDTSTYGETFTAPTDGDTNLQDFGFYMGGPSNSGDILLSGYIGTWTGSQVGTVLYSSPSVDYANTGEDFLSFTTGGLDLTGGDSYVMFLSVSQYSGESSGESYATAGGTIPGGSFVYNNNGGDFSALTSGGWSAESSPDWAVNLDFTPGGTSPVPEPPSFFLLAAGLLGGLAMLFRRKLHA